MAIRTERIELRHGRRVKFVISTPKQNQRPTHSRSYYHKCGTQSVKINDGHEGMGTVVHGRENILRLREFVNRVCKLEGWKKK